MPKRLILLGALYGAVACTQPAASGVGEEGRLMNLRYLYPSGYDDSGLRLKGNRFLSPCGLDSMTGFPVGSCWFPVERVGRRTAVLHRKVALGYHHFQGDSLVYRFNALTVRRDTVVFEVGRIGEQIGLRLNFSAAPWWIALR